MAWSSRPRRPMVVAPMNGQLPSHPAQALPYIRLRIETWTEHRAAIGVSEAALDASRETLEAAEEARRAMLLAQQALRGAMSAYHDAAARARKAASVVITLAQAHAAATDDERVYRLADIKPPAVLAGGRAGRRAIENRLPAQPRNLRATLDGGTGNIMITWSCSQPRGVENVVYEIRRGEGPVDAGSYRAMRVIGFAGSAPEGGARGSGRPAKSFVDEAVPRGVGELLYTVTARVGGRAGPVSDVLVVSLGSVEAPGREFAGATGRPAFAA